MVRAPTESARNRLCANTVRNEIKRGTGWRAAWGIFSPAKPPQDKPYTRKIASGAARSFLEKKSFISFVESCEGGWSLDACVGYALNEGLFTRGRLSVLRHSMAMFDLGLLGIKEYRLPKLRRSLKNAKNRENRRDVGVVLKNDRQEANDRSEFGHWKQTLSSVQRKRMTAMLCYD